MSKNINSQRKLERARRRKRLAKQLAAYSVAASAGMFAADQASAAIVHYDLGDATLLSSNTNLFFDLDGGVISTTTFPGADLNLQYFNFVGSKQTARFVNAATNTRVRVHNAGTNRIPKYPSGKLVDATHPLERNSFQGPAGMADPAAGAATWGSSTFGYLSYYSYGGNSLAGSANLLGTTDSVFNDGATRWHASLTSHASLGSGYVPIQFDIGGLPHYGWMRMEMWGQNDGFANPDGAAVTVYEWAYETTANLGILTGDVGSVEAEAVPEPATLGMLALGAAGLGALAMRRRKGKKA